MAFPFRELWCVDFEFRSDPGERPWPVCMVACEFISGQEIRMWRDQLLELRRAPFDTGPDVAFVAYFASAELGCFLELGWPLPVNVIDLFTEHRVETNGHRLLGQKLHDGKQPRKNSLLNALAIRGLAHIDVREKEAMRQLIIGQRQWSEVEKREILDYCSTDVIACIALLRAMAEKIDWPRAKLRGRYMGAVARMERTGIPIDSLLHQKLMANWEPLKHFLIAEVNPAYGVYDENGSLRQARLEQYLHANNISWPRLPSGALELKIKTFSEQADAYPQLRPQYELHATLSQLRLADISVGVDHRARCLLSPFQSVTGRNQPSNSKFVFGPARWIRGLVKEQEGRALAHIDWSAQEVAIAAGLSGDERMAHDYLNDPYLSFAKAAGLLPPGATEEEDIRQICKSIVLGTGYGMGPRSMAFKAKIATIEARELYRAHKAAYPKFWRWIDNTVTTALFRGEIQTSFGWRRYVERNANPRSLMNFPMQANGAEMMRIAAIAATEAGIEVCCPIHDAFVISAPVDQIHDAVATMRTIMSKASRVVTDGLDVRTDAKIVCWPERYMDKRGKDMWDRVMSLLDRVQEPAFRQRKTTFPETETDLSAGDTPEPTFPQTERSPPLFV
jgi:DNA polymerase-1